MKNSNTAKVTLHTTDNSCTEASDSKPLHEPSTLAEYQQASVEIGGRNGPEPTRYGDWEKNGRCIDF